ncbi:hypothetical protein DFH09DRAFT_1082261 [Mycena vulgaris]|nr:hypothetical protein DFH09DRAFT_1082261 [Mycena vulgaris]
MAWARNLIRFARVDLAPGVRYLNIERAQSLFNSSRLIFQRTKCIKRALLCPQMDAGRKNQWVKSRVQDGVRSKARGSRSIKNATNDATHTGRATKSQRDVTAKKAARKLGTSTGTGAVRDTEARHQAVDLCKVHNVDIEPRQISHFGEDGVRIRCWEIGDEEEAGAGWVEFAGHHREGIDGELGDREQGRLLRDRQYHATKTGGDLERISNPSIRDSHGCGIVVWWWQRAQAWEMIRRGVAGFRAPRRTLDAAGQEQIRSTVWVWPPRLRTSDDRCALRSKGLVGHRVFV